ncbi:DJ-1/PfpI family protein [Glaciimonas sp. PAMC28666]|uniref:DJ-1/PfpI family protein n=1 Tax=Glaciimonas sp. PAMC28666 TaxID=2807626 RepID=UPI001966737C|nr:DJ-1/PfpI family protein [Glaciimonas sp. PAMC28666]QRX82725.1 DJ-1/PfpI family protein [Glaciimonas sp. PAMC28666]
MFSIGIVIFDDVEILDFSGPYEVFSTAARVHARLPAAQTLFRCFLIADEMRPIHTRGGMRVLPDCVLVPSADIDVLIVPGGDVSLVLNNPAVINWIAAQAGNAMITASVCTGAFLLARAGLLNGLQATTHWQDIDEMQAAFPAVTVRPDVPWIDCGAIVTSAGIAAGIDMSLHLVERLAGGQLAHATAKQMEYRWNPYGTDNSAAATDSRLYFAA